MNIDTQELRQVAQAETTAAQPPRLDLYSSIHKAMRAVMTDTLLAVGRVDTGDEADLAEMAGRLEGLLTLCSQHLLHENTFVHPALEARASGASLTIATEHVEHVRHIAALRADLQALLLAPAGAREPLALALYRELALFVAENFHHMQQEETAHNAALWAHYSDGELAQVHQALVSSIPPEEMMEILRWMVPAMSPAERAGMLGEMQAQAPAPAFEAALAVVRPHLTQREWAKLCRSLNRPDAQA